jgi:hypothetical protein
MFMSDDEVDSRLNSPRNILSRVPRAQDSLPNIDLDSVFIPDFSDLDSPISISDFNSSSDLKDKINNKDMDPFEALKYHKALDRGLGLPGRKPGIRNRTIEENAAVGLSSILLGRTASEQMFGVGTPQQGLIRHGLTGSLDIKEGRGPKQELLDSIYSHGRSAAEKAFQKLDLALECLTRERIARTKHATDLARIATSMARIVHAVTPKDDREETRGVHFHIYHPEQEPIESYDTVEVRPDGTVTVERDSQPRPDQNQRTDKEGS